MWRYMVGMCWGLSLGLSLNAFADPRLPEGFSLLCELDATCSVQQPTIIAFGAGNQLTYKVLRGSFTCDARTFQQARSETTKACLIPSLGDIQTPANEITTLQKPSGERLDSSLLKDGRYAIISKLSGKALSIHKSSQDDGARLVQDEYVGSQNQFWDVSVLEDGSYSILASHSGKSLDIRGWEKEDGAKLQQLDWTNSLNQHWNIQYLGGTNFSITSSFNEKSLDVFQLKTLTGADVRLWTFWGGDNQQWQFLRVEAPQKVSSTLTF